MSTTLTEERLAALEHEVLEYLREHDSITNRKLREFAGVSYDQAIFFFNQMLDRGVLQRAGVSSGIRYVLP